MITLTEAENNYKELILRRQGLTQAANEIQGQYNANEQEILRVEGDIRTLAALEAEAEAKAAEMAAKATKEAE